MRPAWVFLAGAAVLAGCAGAPPSVDSALRERLEGLRLSVRSVACVDSGIRAGGEPVFRCHVNFGDPHVVPYCALVRGDELVTDREDPSLRCYPPEDEARYRRATLTEPS